MKTGFLLMGNTVKMAGGEVTYIQIDKYQNHHGKPTFTSQNWRFWEQLTKV